MAVVDAVRECLGMEPLVEQTCVQGRAVAIRRAADSRADSTAGSSWKDRK